MNKDRMVLVAAALCAAGFAACLLGAVESGATWKPEFADQNPRVIEWFNNAKLAPAARAFFSFTSCCEKADRLMTKVIPAKDKYDRDIWMYYSDPACTWKGCPLVVIPWYTIHEDPLPDGPEFEQLRAEGVLFIYEGKVTCFWKPQISG